jgi:uncharacterized membrane protein HdeD (DUF308 family)
LDNANIKQPLIGNVHWWTVLLEGIAALIIGILLITMPAITIFAAVSILGAYWFIIGILAIASIFADRSHMGIKLIVGILGIIAGLAILAYPIISTIIVPLTFVLYIGILGVILGLVSLYRAAKSRTWEHAVTGVISILFGLIIIINPVAAIIVFSYILGAVGIVGGIIAIAAALRLRSAAKRLGIISSGQAMSSVGPGPEPGGSTTLSGDKNLKL